MLKKKLEEARKNLVDIKAAVEKGEKNADDLQKAIDAVKAAEANLKAAEEAAALIKALGTKNVDEEGDEADEPAYRTVGETVAAAFQKSGKTAKAKFNLSVPEIKAAAPMGLPSGLIGPLADVDKRVVEGYRRPLLVADLFSSERISGTALTYFVESATVEGTPAETAQGAAKPMTSFGDPTAVTEALKKIASYMKESSELVEDAPWLADAINGRGMYLHELAVEDYLISKLTGTSGIGTSNELTADGIFKAMMAVQNNSGFAADAVVINPTDYQALRLAKDSNLQYYGGGYFYAPYGNNGVTEQPPLWGLRTVVTSAVPAGTCIVGAFKMGASIVRKSGVTVDITNTNEDDFIKNLITILIEERLALAVRRPAAFVEITAGSES